MCTVLLPPDVNPIAVKGYIIINISTPMYVVGSLPAPTFTVILQSVMPSHISNIFTTDQSTYLFSAIRRQPEICCLEWQECGSVTSVNTSISHYVESVRISTAEICPMQTTQKTWKFIKTCC